MPLLHIEFRKSTLNVLYAQTSASCVFPIRRQTTFSSFTVGLSRECGIIFFGWLFSLGCFLSQFPFWSLNRQLHIFVLMRKNYYLSVHAFTWTAQRKWNCRIFDNHSGDFQSLWDSFTFNLCSWISWAKISPLSSMYSIDSFVSNIGACLLPREVAS